jgi:hypothetical protein
MVNLHISLYEFWDYTPAEIDIAFSAYNNKKSAEVQQSWEQIRTQIYYSYLFAPTGKRKVSFNHFKREYLPFSFDKENEPIQVIDDDAFASIQDFFKKIKGTQN